MYKDTEIVGDLPSIDDGAKRHSVYTTSNGCPVLNPHGAQRIGSHGPLLLQDFHLIDLLAHFNRERIPERAVHAKGAGAYGEFVVSIALEALRVVSNF